MLYLLLLAADMLYARNLVADIKKAEEQDRKPKP
jgi:hypothetical protein